MLFTTEAPFANLLAPRGGAACPDKPSKPGPAETQQPRSKPTARPKPKAEPTRKAELKKEPNITRIPNAKGGVKFRVQIRSRVGGSLTKTFSDLKRARAWRDRQKVEIEEKGFPMPQRGGLTVADVITARLALHTELGRSAQQVLNAIKDCEFGQIKVHALTKTKVYEFGRDLLNKDRKPQTVATYMTILAKTLEWARKREMGVPVGVVPDAIALLWEDGILARSEQRNRRPELDELDRILTLVAHNKRQKLPLVILIVFAIFSVRRLGEICRLRWEDVDFEEKKVLVRDMKHPRKKKGNDVWCSLTDEAMAIIEAMPRTGEYVFPYNANSASTAFRRYVEKAGIKDLHFHDLRHEGVSRLFEMGWSAAFVAKVSGHKTSAMLDRYEHVKTRGDNFAGWGWLLRAIAGINA